MLDTFPSETAAHRIERKPAEPVGFISEATLVRPTVAPTISAELRRDTPSTSSSRAKVLARKTSSPNSIAIMTRTSRVRCVAIVLAAVAGGWTSQYKNEIVRAPDAPASALRVTADKPLATSFVLRAPAVKPVASLPPAFAPIDSRSYGEAGSLAEAVVPAVAVKPQPRVNSRSRRNAQLPRRQPVGPKVAGPQPTATTGLVRPKVITPKLVGVPASEGGTDETAVRALLERYRGAYERLDADAASHAWPSMDRRVLARAFADLNSQSLTFDSCQIDVADGRGVASCRGRSTYVGRVGSRTPHSREGEWTFSLKKTGDEWHIDTVRSR